MQAEQQSHEIAEEGYEVAKRAYSVSLPRYSKQRRPDPRQVVHIQLQAPLIATACTGERFHRNVHQLTPRVAAPLIGEGLGADYAVACERNLGARIRRADSEIVNECPYLA